MAELEVKIEWLPPEMDENGSYVVRGQARSSLGYTIRLGYRLASVNECSSEAYSNTEWLKQSGFAAQLVKSCNLLNADRRRATQDQIERKIRALESGQGECGMTHQELVSLTYEEYQARYAAWHAADRARRSAEWSEALRARFRDSEVKERHQVVIEHDVDDQPWVTW